MNLFLALLFNYLKNERVEITTSELTLNAPTFQVVFPDLDASLLEILSMESFLLVREIQEVLRDESYNTPQEKLGAIECLFDEYRYFD